MQEDSADISENVCVCVPPCLFVFLSHTCVCMSFCVVYIHTRKSEALTRLAGWGYARGPAGEAHKDGEYGRFAPRAGLCGNGLGGTLGTRGDRC